MKYERDRSTPTPCGLRRIVLLVVLGFGVGQGTARADVDLPMVATSGTRVRVDGWLREWPTSQFAAIGAATQGRLRVAFSPGERGLYIAASVDDDRMIRTSRASLAEDAIVITLASPNADGTFATSEVRLFAGVANETAATIAVGTPDGRMESPREATVVEMATSSGYEIEAFLPWASVPGATDYARARAVARLHDVDASGAAGTDVSSAARATNVATTMPRIVGSVGELFPFASFLRAKRASSTDVEVDLRANFAGDARAERVVVVGGTIAIFGSGYSNGRDFDYADLGVARGAISDARAIDVDGDGRSELLFVATRAEGNATVRELRIFRFPGDRFVSMFRAEIGLASAAAAWSSEWAVTAPPRGLPEIRIAAATNSGTGATRPHVPEPDVVALLLPSSGVTSRTYGYANSQFAFVSEERPAESAPVATTGAAPTGTPPRGHTTTTGRTTTTPTATSTATAAVNPPTQTPPPRTTGSGFQSANLLGAVRRDRSVPDSVPVRYSLTADLIEDARAEEVHVLGRSLVIIGPGYRSGAGYFALDVGVTDPEQLVGVSARDVTGDGKAEIWVNVRQPIGQPPTFLELLVIYRFDAQGLSPIFTAQIALGDGTRIVRNEARVTGSGRALELAIAPGRAVGYEPRTFPFSSTATAGMTSLLLPWRDRELRYRWNGSAIVGP